MRVLFICTANRLRSPTAEAVFADAPGLEVASAGLDPAAARPLSADLVAWAERIIVMEQRHRDLLKKRFRTALGQRPVYVLGIPDEFTFMQPELIALLQDRVLPLLE